MGSHMHMQLRPSCVAYGTRANLRETERDMQFAEQRGMAQRGVHIRRVQRGVARHCSTARRGVQLSAWRATQAQELATGWLPARRRG